MFQTIKELFQLHYCKRLQLFTTGLIPFLYRKSRADCTGLNANLITFLICPLSKPADAHQDALSLFTALLSPAHEPARFTPFYFQINYDYINIIKLSQGLTNENFILYNTILFI